MSWKEEGTKFESAPVGTHLARCIKIIDIGTQTGEYKGERTVARKNIIFWELPLELRDDGKPFIVSKFYTASLGEKANLRKDLVAWRGKEFTSEELRGFDERNILGAGCQVTVIEKDNGKTAITAISGLPKGVPLPAQVNPSFFFSLNDFEQEKYDSLSDGIKKLIKDSAEYDSLNVSETPSHTGEKAEAATVGGNDAFKELSEGRGEQLADDDIPFALIFAFIGMAIYLATYGQNIIS